MALQPIPLAGESYQLAATPGAQHRLLNLYAEALPDAGRAKFYLQSTPGLTQRATTGSGPVLSAAAISGTYFAISGTNAYTLFDNGTTIATNTGSVGAVPSDYYHTSIAIGLTAPVFVVPPRAYVGNFSLMPIQQITTAGGNWPASGVSCVCYLDGYYIFTSFNGESFFTSNLLSPTNFSGLSFVKSSSEVDFFEHCRAFNRELWLFGPNAISIWYNTGDPINPFSPRSGALIRPGCGAYRTIAELDRSLFFLGVDGVVYRTQGYAAKRISTHAIEENIAGYEGGYLRTISACAFTYEGHGFYALQLPAVGRTFVYDCSTDLWHERSSSATGSTAWQINTATQLGARWIFGDSVNGTLWQPSRSTQTEKGIAVQRMAQLPALVTHGPRAFMSRLEVEMQTGISGQANPLLLSWSDDGGYTYKSPRQLDTGNTGQVRKRIYATRLGSFRQRIIRLAGSGPMTIFGVDADVGAGDS